jgi:hypothetical protein
LWLVGNRNVTRFGGKGLRAVGPVGQSSRVTGSPVRTVAGVATVA